MFWKKKSFVKGTAAVLKLTLVIVRPTFWSHAVVNLLTIACDQFPKKEILSDDEASYL